MKREIFAAATLLLLFVAALLNIRALESFCADSLALIDDSRALAEEGNWSAAALVAEQVGENWRARRAYTHVFLRHTELDAVSAAYYEYLTCLYAQRSDELPGRALALRARLVALLRMERISLGTVF